MRRTSRAFETRLDQSNATRPTPVSPSISCRSDTPISESLQEYSVTSLELAMITSLDDGRSPGLSVDDEAAETTEV